MICTRLGCRRSIASSHTVPLSRGLSSFWCRRQKLDHYVRERNEGEWRARSAFKLIEMDKKFNIFRRHGPEKLVLVDIGAAPGSWSQVVSRKLKGKSTLIMNDLQYIEPIEGATFIQGDFLENSVRRKIVTAATGKDAGSFENENHSLKVVDCVLSDMAPNTSGTGSIDHIRQIELAFQAFEFAKMLLKPSGIFLCKIFSGEEDLNLANAMKNFFKEFKRVKPSACRKESRELYFFGRGLKNVDSQ